MMTRQEATDTVVLDILRDAYKWLGKAKAEGVHKDCIMPRHLEITLLRVKDLIATYETANA